jgi:hypothetical protein
MAKEKNALIASESWLLLNADGMKKSAKYEKSYTYLQKISLSMMSGVWLFIFGIM